MIISRTPFRVSFFGGGTDYPVYYREHGGAVLSTTIDKYCYITCRHLPPFFDHKHRIIYSKSEHVTTIDEIDHPSVREVFRFMQVTQGMEVHHDADLPAKSGLGSSSAFTVGLLNTLYALRGEMVTKKSLALEAIHIEQNMIKENVGSQDQVAAATGGFNKIRFNTDDTIEVDPIILPKERVQELQNHLLFFFTGFARFASQIAEKQVQTTRDKITELKDMHAMVDHAMEILANPRASINEFGDLLHQSWLLKRSLTDKISTSEIDNIYETARGAGASGGKLIGAGGGGFMLFFARPSAHEAIRKALSTLLHVPIAFEKFGSQIIVYDP